MANPFDEYQQLQQRPGVSPAARSRLLLILWSLASVCLGQDADPVVPKPTYHFLMLKGRGQAVCTGFLQRLNTTKYTKPPYCDIPENDSVPGFTKLNRVPLSQDEGVRLWSHIIWFTINQNQFLSSDGWPSSIAKELWGRGISAWKYDPQVSMNNARDLDNVLIWHGPGASMDTSPHMCGAELSDPNGEFIYRTPQRAYILTTNNKQIDETQTRELFGNPQGAKPPERYEAVGAYEGIFEYRGLYYLEVIDESVAGQDDPRFNSILRVFLRQNGRTINICRYGMAATPAQQSQ